MTNLAELRSAEFNCVKHYFPPDIGVLEIGGGSGLQANLIAACGAKVESIDVAAQPDGSRNYYPVSLYDGRIIPFPDHTFDRVFSSNVLEHIHDLETALAESRRVMKDDGVAIHILPTPAWRIWTSFSHYLHMLMRITGIRRPVATNGSAYQVADMAQKTGIGSVIKHVLLAGPHGEYPSALSELWYFSRKRWIDVFSLNGFQVVATQPSDIFYTGYAIFPWLSMPVRRALARMLGSATRIYVLRKAS